MPISDYLRNLRPKIGHDRVLTPGVCVLIFNHRGEVLLHRAADDGKWHTIGGAIDPGEEPAAAAIREAKEETNLDIRVERIVSVYAGPSQTYANGDEVDYFSVALACRVIDAAAEMFTADGEALELRWFPPDALPENLKALDRRAIEQAVRGEPAKFY